jgi:hypothetical protein
MAIRRANPPWVYLQGASDCSLQSYELSRLNHAANLRREIAALMDQWIEHTAQASLARWMLDQRYAQRQIEAADTAKPAPEPPFLNWPDEEPPRTIRALRPPRRNQSPRPATE